jgi:tRNA threonylcarbamoyladenosine biosynthesis protein TsaE
LKPGDVVAFYGDLGAGKTTMIKGVAAGLGVADVVKSPSFVIVTEYRGRLSESSSADEPKSPPSPLPPPSRGREQREGLPVYHIDLYRLGARGEGRGADDECQMSDDEIEVIGLDSYLDGDGVCLIEWAERAEGILPDTAILVRMSVEGSNRRIEIEGLRTASG